MGDLTPAHRGYEYQDLLVACRLVDMLLDTVAEAYVDKKLVKGDRFDDLTIRDASGHHERSQFKHTDAPGSPLKLSTFTTDARSLRLDRLVGAAVAYRDGPGTGASSIQFRVVMRDAPPTDAKLAAALMTTSPDPGPFLAGMGTTRLRFNVDVLWPTGGQAVLAGAAGDDAFGFLRAGESQVDRTNLEWLCDRLVVEVGAPAMTMDLRAPGQAERLLLNRVHQELGAGLYPNEHRSVVDVAEALIRATRTAREGGPPVTRTELLRRTQLRQDFGAVARADPVDPAIEVPRATAVSDLAAAVREAAVTGGTVIATGSPGQGKSWACQQLIDRLIGEGWIVAEHYCYLGDADGDRLSRVMAETVFGSLLGRVADADPSAVNEQRPRFAADEQALVAAVTNVLRWHPGQRVALVVDGLDHVTRVQARAYRVSAADPSFALAEALSALQLPESSVLIVLSQPGRHLLPLEQGGGITVQVPPLTESELRLMAVRLGVIPSSEAGPGTGEPLLADDAMAQEFLAALAERSAGNALYATYLCREVRARPDATADAATVVRALPAFDGTLESYYAHLYSTLGADGAWVADVLALLDVPVTRQELREIMPDRAHRVDTALDILGPVLADRVGEGGIRVYHESFARYLRLPYQDAPEALVAVLDRIAGWLTAKGMFADPRAFSSLLRILADAGHDDEVIQRTTPDFVTRAVAAGYPASMIRSNLATAVRCAARAGDWTVVIRSVEMSRAADTYQHERFDSALIDHADVPIRLMGPQIVADRLVHDGRPVMSGRAGVQMCAAVDAAGAVAPWWQYLAAYRREAETDNTSYGAESDLRVSLATLRGRLRLSAQASSEPPSDIQLEDVASDPPDQLGGADTGDEFAAAVSLHKVSAWLDRQQSYNSTVSVVRALADTHGAWAVAALIWRQARPGATCLAFAEEMAAGRCPDNYGSARSWAAAAAAYGVPAGSAHRLLRLGLVPDDITGNDIAHARQHLLDLTREAQQHDITYEGQVTRVAAWLDLISVAAHRDDLGLNTAEALITGPGWYRCWLRFAIALIRAEHASPEDQSGLALQAVSLLAEDLDPFAGDPRACDLYWLHSLIGDTIQRAVMLLADADWEAALQILTEVSGAMTVTMRGELGGPLPPDELLEIVVSTAAPANYAAAEAIVRTEMVSGAAGRYYSDLARYRMIGARLAINAGDVMRAQALWADACRFLTAYGWHKDITIYELLDPLPSLIAANSARGRLAVASVQPLCERVPMHTDGKETRHAWQRWWELLADADPVALAQLAAPALLAKCNMPNYLLHEARYELWQRWHASSDPVAAAALRLTLDTPLDGADPTAAARLAGESGEAAGNLLRLVLSRADERAHADTASRAAADDVRVAELNLVADAAGAPRIQPCSQERPPQDVGSGNRAGLPQPSLQKQLDHGILPELPAGAVGLSRAIRAWHAASFDDRRTIHTLDQFAALIGYRLVELAESGREADVAAVLRVLGGSDVYSEGALLLGHLAEGLERFGYHGLAAQAYTLAWTRARGGGGWLNFGGQTALDALHNATRLAPAIARDLVAEETERIVASGQYGTNGVTQALVIAFAAEALTLPGADSIDNAFAMWDEALAVIADRAPRVDDTDDPDQPYTAPYPDDGSRIPGNLDRAFATAALAGLSHAGREAKRRSLLAAQALITQRPDIAAPAAATALAKLSDPATLTWLLCLLSDQNAEGRRIAEHCTTDLRALAQGPYLTIRAIARRLLPPGEAAALPLGPSDASLLPSPRSALWVPEAPDDDEDAADDAPTELVRGVAGARLIDAASLVPGLAEAVLHRVARDYASPELRSRMKVQLRAYRDSTVRDRWPDAYLAIEEAVEEALQRTAAGARAARLAAGLPSAEPAAREDDLATALTDSPQIPLALEATRYPRPLLPALPEDNAPLWAAIAAATHGSAPGPSTVLAARTWNGKLMATTAMRPAGTIIVLDGGPYDGWCVIGTAERRIYPAHRYSDEDRRAYFYTALEARRDGDGEALDRRPLAAGNLWQWINPLPSWDAPDPLTETQPLLGIDHDMKSAGDAASGLGIPPEILVPTDSLISALGLRHGQPMALNDAAGPGLALITWRTGYKQSEYHLAWPRITGCAVVLRPDLMPQLSRHAQATLVIREFIVGDETLHRTDC
jgi:hypothetical protein